MDIAGELESSIIITACRHLATAPITMGVSGNGTEEVAEWKGSERNVEGKIWVWAGLWWAFLLYVIGLEEVEEKEMKVPTLLRAKICWILSSKVSRRATSGFGQAPSGSSHAVEGGGMTIGRVMDWTEVRVDAIKTREEEEDEDEEGTCWWFPSVWIYCGNSRSGCFEIGGTEERANGTDAAKRRSIRSITAGWWGYSRPVTVPSKRCR